MCFSPDIMHKYHMGFIDSTMLAELFFFTCRPWLSFRVEAVEANKFL